MRKDESSRHRAIARNNREHDAHVPLPTPIQVAEYFCATYGTERLFFTITAFDNQSSMLPSTFGRDNFEYMQPWLLLQTAKVYSGKVRVIAMVVRVFDMDHLVEVEGPNGKITIPEKELYMFRFDSDSSVGLDPADTWTMHCTDAGTGMKLPREEGVRFGSGEAVVAALNQIAKAT